MAAVNFVLLSTQRSGSTLLRTALDSHPEVSCKGEVFLSSYGGGHSFADFLAERRLPILLGLLRRRKFVYEFLDKLYGEELYKAVGLKLMYDHVGYRPYKFPMVMEYLRRNSVRVIHLIRENPLDTCISRQSARKTKIWHVMRDEESPKVMVDIPLLLKEIRIVEASKCRWRSKLKGFRTLEVGYEEFVSDRSRTAGKILEFIDVDAGVELVSPYKRILAGPLRERVLNYQELKEELHLKGLGGLLKKE